MYGHYQQVQQVRAQPTALLLILEQQLLQEI